VTASVTEVKSSSAKKKAYLSSLGIWIPLSVCLIWLALLPKIVPGLNLDRGIFVSVAERILAGDVLYRDVWDNKDPLFYFSIALGRLVSPYADVFMEIFWIACAAAAVLVLARWRGCDSRNALFLGFGMTPLILTGGLYVPGFTHLPGTAVALMVMAASVSRRYVIAGALIAVLTFLKIIMLPVAFLLFLTVILIRRRWVAIVPAGVAFTLTASAILWLLEARGELSPYVQSLILNVSYSQGNLLGGKWGPVIDHLLRAKSIASIGALATILLCFACALVASRRHPRVLARNERSTILLACIGSSLLAGLVVLSFTGLWPHHGQVLYVASVLVALDVVYRIQPIFNVRSMLPIVAFVCLAVMLSGPATPTKYLGSVLSAPQSIIALGEAPAESRAVLSVAPSGTYARVGKNDDDGHAFGLGNWKLACPRFHQYPFDSSQVLDGVVDCLPGAGVIVVSPTAVPVAGNTTWNTFLDKVETTLGTHYSCALSGVERICTRREG
jgi:hypothetical protein